MNIICPISYGTQQPIALLKLMLEKQGIYDRSKDLVWKSIKDVSFVSAMISSPRCNVDGRFLSKFNTFTFDIPTDTIVSYTYASILKGHLIDFQPDIVVVAEQIVSMTLNLFKVILLFSSIWNSVHRNIYYSTINSQVIRAQLPATPPKFHYIFNLKDLSRIFAGLLVIKSQMFTTGQHLVRVWRNEFSRVICDRLNTEQVMKIECPIVYRFETKTNYPKDLILLNERMSEEIDRQFIPAKNSTDLSMREYVMADPLLYGDFRNAFKDDEPRHYEELDSYDLIQEIFTEVKQLVDQS